MAKKRKAPTSKRGKAMRSSVGGTGRTAVDVGKAAIALAQRIKELRAEVRALKASVKKSRKKRG